MKLSPNQNLSPEDFQIGIDQRVFTSLFFLFSTSLFGSLTSFQCINFRNHGRFGFSCYLCFSAVRPWLAPLRHLALLPSPNSMHQHASSNSRSCGNAWASSFTHCRNWFCDERVMTPTQQALPSSYWTCANCEVKITATAIENNAHRCYIHVLALWTTNGEFELDTDFATWNISNKYCFLTRRHFTLYL